MRKLNSTNALNQAHIHNACTAAYALSLFSGRWKPVILWLLYEGAHRNSELYQAMNGISTRILARQLQELEAANLISRTATPIPLYSLTSHGHALMPLLHNLATWGYTLGQLPSSSLNLPTS